MHCVLVVENGTVLDQGVASILGQEPGLDVTSLTYTEEAAFLDAVSRARPDIILVNEMGPLDPSRVFELLENDSLLIVPRVIMVHAGSNRLDVYERRTVVATQCSDLVTLIQAGLDAKVPQGGWSMTHAAKRNGEQTSCKSTGGK